MCHKAARAAASRASRQQRRRRQGRCQLGRLLQLQRRRLVQALHQLPHGCGRHHGRRHAATAAAAAVAARWCCAMEKAAAAAAAAVHPSHLWAQDAISRRPRGLLQLIRNCAVAVAAAYSACRQLLLLCDVDGR